MKYIISFLLNVLVSVAYATPVINPQTEQNPFQVLKNAFDSADPATLDDYPLLTDLIPVETAKIHCVYAAEGDVDVADTLIPSIIGRFSYTVPGVPDNGPLFPGQPSSVVVTLSATLHLPTFADMPFSDQSVIYDYASEMVDLPIVSRSNSGDLQTTDSRDGDSTYTDLVIYRKKGNELLWYELSRDADENGDNAIRSDTYGHCY